MTSAGVGAFSRIGSLIATVVVVFWVAYFPLEQANYSLRRGNQLSEFFDSYSEANTIRAGEGFLDHGLTYNKGLPDLAYGNAFEGQGGKHDPHLCANPAQCVYLHAPPGPELAAGVATKMCGRGEISCFRTLPILIQFLSLAFFAWAAARALGVTRAAFVLSTFHFVPMITNGANNLYHGYTASILLVHLGVLLLALVKPVRSVRFYAIALGVVGFFYGWFSYDIVFHVMFAAFAIALLTRDWGANRNSTLIYAGAAFGGFLFAGLLHFIQVADYLGGVAAAYEDFARRAASRAGVGKQIEPLPDIGRFHIFMSYTTLFLKEPQNYGGQYLAACAATLTALLPRKPIGFRLFGQELEWAPSRTAKWGFLVAFVIPLFWIMVMRQHAAVHGHFLPRNFIITFVVGALLLASSLRRKSAEPSGAVKVGDDLGAVVVEAKT